MDNQARDERARNLGELVRRTRLEERIAVTFEEREMGVHAGARVIGEGLGHERCVETLLKCDFLHDETEGHQVVCGRQSIGVTKIDLLLTGAAFVVAVFDRDAHCLEHGDRLTSEVVRDTIGSVVEVAVAIDGLGDDTRARCFLEEVELDLGVRVEREAEICSLGQGALEHVTRIGITRCAIGHEDVAKHASYSRTLTAPRQQREGCGVRLDEHVGFVDASEALNGRTVEANALGEGTLQLGRRNGDRLQGAEHVGEPQPHETDVTFFNGAEYEFGLLVHASSVHLYVLRMG